MPVSEFFSKASSTNSASWRFVKKSLLVNVLKNKLIPAQLVVQASEHKSDWTS